MAPIFVNGKVLVGISGGEFEKRGFVAAYDARTGKMLWRFYTAPGPGYVGHSSWAGHWWFTGGATVWSSIEVDRRLGLLYIHTGNASPDFNGSQRAGNNLFSVSLVALDLRTGRYRWHFQEVHHDIWDYDSAQPAQLFTLVRGNRQIPVIAHANKDGFFFILDRRNGKPEYPVTEVPVSTVPAWQHPSPTQPESSIVLIPQKVTDPPPGFEPRRSSLRHTDNRC